MLKLKLRAEVCLYHCVVVAVVVVVVVVVCVLIVWLVGCLSDWFGALNARFMHCQAEVLSLLGALLYILSKGMENADSRYDIQTATDGLRTETDIYRTDGKHKHTVCTDRRHIDTDGRQRYRETTDGHRRQQTRDRHGRTSATEVRHRQTTDTERRQMDDGQTQTTDGRWTNTDGRQTDTDRHTARWINCLEFHDAY